MDIEMKRLVLISVSLALAACAVTPDPRPVTSDGETIFTCSLPQDAKASLGERTADGYDVYWSEGDQITVYSEGGDYLGIAGLVSGAGDPVAVFSIPKAIKSGTKVRLVYGDPAMEEEQIKANCFDKSFITMSEPEGLVTVEAGSSNPAQFVHKTSVIRVNVASTAMKGAKVASVIIRSEGAKLSSSGKDYVRLTLQDSLILDTTPKEIIFSCLPADLAGKEVLIAFRLKGKDGSFTLPVSFSGRELKANTVNTFNFDDLSEERCASWYEPHDKRGMETPTFAYGDANTYLIQCKNGATYTGAEYTPDDAIPSSVSISIKARGDILQVSNPQGATFEWAKLQNGSVYSMRTIGYSASAVIPTKYSIEYDGGLSVKVTNDAAFAGSPVLLMKKDGRTLWAWTFWNIAADGTKFGTVDIAGAKVANMDIGQATTQFSAWAANADPVYRTVNRYQYGRPMPVFFNTVLSLDYPDGSSAGNIPVLWGPVSLNTLLENPVGLIASQTPGVDMSPYCSDNSMAKAWGGCGTDTGRKAVFDPCPKGYRIMDRSVVTSLVSAGKTFESNANYPGFYHTESGCMFLRSGYYTQKTVDKSGKLQIGGSQSVSLIWSNYCAGPNTASGTALVLQASSVSVSSAQPKAVCAPVRCQIDEENR